VGAGEIAARTFSPRRDLKGYFGFSHRPAVRRNAAAGQINDLEERTVREVSAYSTVDPALAREAAYSRRHLKWHRLKTGRDQNPY
jgi:hypothetical protein